MTGFFSTRLGQALVGMCLLGLAVAAWLFVSDARHRAMADALTAAHQGALRSEVRFPPARAGHGMVGSGMFVINPPYGLEDEAARLAALFAAL